MHICIRAHMNGGYRCVSRVAYHVIDACNKSESKRFSATESRVGIITYTW